MNQDSHLNQDAQVVDRALFYDAETGEIVGSHTFAVSAKVTDATRRRMESMLHKELEEVQRRCNRKVAIHRSAELNRLTSLHHRVDIATGRLVEHGTTPARIKVE